jgi:hypothetical protein
MTNLPNLGEARERLEAVVLNTNLTGRGGVYPSHSIWRDPLNADISSFLADHTRLEAEVERLRDALTGAIEIAGQARDEWDAAPAGMRAGKILNALAGDVPGYRPDIDAIHAIRARTALGDPQ